MKINLSLILTSLALFYSLISLGQAPNIVFIFVDDQGWNGTSQQMDSSRTNSQSDYYQTPNINVLGQEGMTFSQAYAPAPKCSPSRNSILTGQTTARRQFTNTTPTVNTTKFLLEPSSATNIVVSETTFAEVIQQQNSNYWLAHYGKWHLGAGGPEMHGFDRSDGNTSNLSAQGAVTQADPKLMFEITDSALTFIKDAQNAGRPFYVQLSHYAVHSPSELKPTTLNNLSSGIRPVGTVHKDTLFGGMTEDLDVAVGLLLDSLTAWGLDNNTYVVYMSDNGASAGVSKNTPLSRGKLFLAEGGIRVPLIIRGPNVPVNSYNTTPVIGYDLYPTFVDWMLGSTATVPSIVEGASIKDLANASTQTVSRTNSLIFHSPHYDLSAAKRPESAIRNDSFKFVVDYELGEFALYNMLTDVEEDVNLKMILPSVANNLCLELRDYLKSVGALMPTINPTYAGNGGPVGDYDNDGLDDEWEFRELLTHIYTATDDPDGDGFDNATEFLNSTDPYVFDMMNSVSSVSNEFEVQLFPNPVSTKLNIISQEDFDQVLIYDYTGKKLLKKSRRSTLNVASLPAGIYFLTLEKDGQIVYTEEVTIVKE
jgi:arylsulfatase A-like enzyme